MKYSLLMSAIFSKSYLPKTPQCGTPKEKIVGSYLDKEDGDYLIFEDNGLMVRLYKNKTAIPFAYGTNKKLDTSNKENIILFYSDSSEDLDNLEFIDKENKIIQDVDDIYVQQKMKPQYPSFEVACEKECQFPHLFKCLPKNGKKYCQFIQKQPFCQS